MKALMLISGLWASAALAQSGAWGGYVTGWQPAPLELRLNFIGDTLVEPPTVNFASAPTVPTVFGWPAPLTFKTDEDVEREREEARVAQERAIDLQQAQAQREQDRAQFEAEQLALQQQQLALEQQILAQRQQLALMEEQARVAELEEQAKELEQAFAEAEARARAEEAAQPPEESPDIHRWVDAEGVVHYSTDPPP